MHVASSCEIIPILNVFFAFVALVLVSTVSSQDINWENISQIVFEKVNCESGVRFWGKGGGQSAPTHQLGYLGALLVFQPRAAGFLHF